MKVMRTALVLLTAGVVLTGCGARADRAGDGRGVDAPGILVFSGLGSGSYLHSMRSDARGLRAVELPENCSPKAFHSPHAFTRDGRLLTCTEWDDPWGEFAAVRDGGAWRRVPFPPEMKFPDWITAGMSDGGGYAIDAPEWAPAGDRIALIRTVDAEYGDFPYGESWFSQTGKVVIADVGGTQERVVADEGQVPRWSPDGTRLAFARCRVSEAALTDASDEDTAECSLWVAATDEPKAPEKLVDGTASAPVWSPDGRFVAFFADAGPCSVCRRRILVVPVNGGEAKPVGPELIEPSELVWLPESASAVASRPEKTADDALELQRCADIWNRARMQWPNVVANVSVVKGGCRVTVPDGRDGGLPYAGFACWQPVTFSFQCQSHGGPLHYVNPEQRVWDAHADASGKLVLLRPPKGERLPLPKFPPYPMLDGYIFPFERDGQPRAGLTFTKTVEGTCNQLSYPESVLCSNWSHHVPCFKPRGRLAAGDIVLCPEGVGSTSFAKLKVSKVDESPD